MRTCWRSFATPLATLFTLVPATLVVTAIGGCSSTDHDNNTVDDSGLDGGDSASDSAFTDAHADVVDATSGDAAVDAPLDTSADGALDVDDGAPVPVTVIVRNELAVEQGVAVVFQDSTGAVLTTLTTDATGSASSVVPAGSQVTALMGTTANANIATVTQVAPGDVITLVDTIAKEALDTTVSIATLPASPPASTAEYRVYAGGCEADFMAPPSQMGIRGTCESGGQAPFLAIAVDSDLSPLAFSYLPSFTLGLTADADAGSGDAAIPSVAITVPWSTAMVTDTVTAINGAADTNMDVVSSEIVLGVSFQQVDVLSSSGLDAGSISTPFTHHAGFADAIQDAVIETTPVGGFLGEVGFVDNVAAPTADSMTSFDFATALPQITAATLDTTTATLPSITWTAGGPLGSAGGFAQFHWSTDTDGGASGGVWTIVVPASATSVSAPALPPALSAWGPTAASDFETTPTVFFFDGSLVPSYTALRNSAVTAGLLQIDSGFNLPALPTNSTLRVTGLVPNDG